jgi:hypothetical protein
LNSQRIYKATGREKTHEKTEISQNTKTSKTLVTMTTVIMMVRKRKMSSVLCGQNVPNRTEWFTL